MTAIKIIDIYVDMQSGGVYNSLKQPINQDNAPSILFAEKIKVNIQYMTENPNSPTSLNFTGFAALSLGGFALIENNFELFKQGKLDTAIGAAAPLTSIKVTGISAPRSSSGLLTLINADGNAESIPYTSHTLVAGVYTFTVNYTPINAYPKDSIARQIDAPIIQASSIDYANKATGKFSLTMDGNSEVFLELIRGWQKLDGTYFTHIIMDSSDNSVISAIVFPWTCRGLLALEAIVPPVVPDYPQNFVKRDGSQGFQIGGDAPGDLYYRGVGGGIARLAKGADESKTYGIKWTDGVPALVEASPPLPPVEPPPPAATGTVSKVVGPLILMLKNYFLNTAEYTRMGLLIEGENISLISISRLRIYATNLRELMGDPDVPNIYNEVLSIINDYDLWLGMYEVRVIWEDNQWKFRILYNSEAFVDFASPTLYGTYTVLDKSGTGVGTATITPF